MSEQPFPRYYRKNKIIYVVESEYASPKFRSFDDHRLSVDFSSEAQLAAVATLLPGDPFAEPTAPPAPAFFERRWNHPVGRVGHVYRHTSEDYQTEESSYDFGNTWRQSLSPWPAERFAEKGYPETFDHLPPDQRPQSSPPQAYPASVAETIANASSIAVDWGMGGTAAPTIDDPRDAEIEQLKLQIENQSYNIGIVQKGRKQQEAEITKLRAECKTSCDLIAQYQAEINEQRTTIAGLSTDLRKAHDATASEKETRIKYQEIVYAVCNRLDNIGGQYTTANKESIVVKLEWLKGQWQAAKKGFGDMTKERNQVNSIIDSLRKQLSDLTIEAGRRDGQINVLEQNEKALRELLKVDPLGDTAVDAEVTFNNRADARRFVEILRTIRDRGNERGDT